MFRSALACAFVLTALATIFAGVSCGPGSIDPNQFDRSCRVSSDCVVVEIPQDCCFGCGNLGINKKDLASYNDQAQRIRDDCHGSCPGYDCQPVEAVCRGGLCDLCTNCVVDAGADGP